MVTFTYGGIHTGLTVVTFPFPKLPFTTHYRDSQQEIKQLTKEADSGKEELLEIVRSQEKDIKFFERVVQIMLNDSDQYKLKQRSTWDEDSREWSIPLFILNKMQDEVAFPTIGAKARV